MGFWKQNVWIKLENNFGKEGVFDNGNVRWFMLRRAFCVEPGIFVSNRAFLCQTMQFAVERVL